MRKLIWGVLFLSKFALAAATNSQIISVISPLSITSGVITVGTGAMQNILNMGGHKINNLSPGSASTDAVTLGQLNATCTPFTWGNINGNINNQGDLINLVQSKAPYNNPTFTGSVGVPIAANSVVVTDSSSKLAASSTSATQLSYLDISSSLTGLLASKAPLASPTFTGTLTTPLSAGIVQSSSGGVLSVGNVSLTSQVSGTLPIANGGTGQTSANASLNALLPTQTSNSGKFLTTNGTNSSWASFTGAFTDLSNLTSPTAINQNLLFSPDSTYTIGDDTGGGGVGRGRPVVVDTPRVNAPTLCFAENSNTGAGCLTRTSGTTMKFDVGGTAVQTWASGNITFGLNQVLTLNGPLSFNSGQKIAMTTGSGTVLGANSNYVLLHATGTISSYTVTLPSSPQDQQPLIIMTDATVTTLTLTPAGGQTVIANTWASGAALNQGSSIRLYWENQYGEWVTW